MSKYADDSNLIATVSDDDGDNSDMTLSQFLDWSNDN
jgi:hypothetical protein